MKLSANRILILLFILLAGTASVGFTTISKLANGDPILTALIEKFTRFQKANPQEKVYIQTDKPFYLPGDTIWYKAYVLDATDLTPSTISSYLNVVVSAAGQYGIKTQKIKLTAGTGQGQLALPKDLKTGNYTLQGYTNWGRNFAPEFSYSRTFTVYNPEEKETTATNTSTPTITFYPEGGYLVNELESKVGFKITDMHGNGTALSGKIVDSNNRQIATFTSNENGIGNFEFIPKKGRTYKSIVYTSDGKTIEATLPTPLNEGLVMQVDNSDESVCSVSVKRSNNASNTTDKVHLLLESRGELYLSASAEFKRSSAIILNLPKTEVPEGVAKLTLFNQEGKPEIERLIYINKKQRLSIEVTPKQKTYTSRQPVTVDIQVKDQHGNPVQANLSVAVTDQKALPAPDETILSGLYLSSEINGLIEKPAAYFSAQGDVNVAAVDNLLLTQGWRRFTWKQITETVNFAPKLYPQEKQHLFYATIVDASGKPIPDAVAMLVFTGPGFISAAGADEKGNISMLLPDAEKSGGIIYNILKDDKPVVGAKLAVAHTTDPSLTITQAGTNYLTIAAAYTQKANEWHRIQQAFYGDLPKPEVPAKPTFTANFSKPTVSYNMSEYIQFKSLTELINETLDPVSLRTDKDGTEILLYNRDTGKRFPNSPLFLVDGYPTFDNKTILNIPMSSIRKLEVYNTVQDLKLFGHVQLVGVMALYTKPNSYNAARLVQNAFPFEGIYTSREFYQPTADMAKPNKPVFRPNPYWQASVKTDSNGRASITFNTLDDLSDFRIIVEGISMTGTPGVGEATYTVRANEL
ncbi:hypothetical protein H8S95_17340 [Pontibacter sp. KCTC 32443]|uniref:MG2 domain-containing protein n=1 Tax=Pontibacter TaxID=323449 RepID=UPI00164D21A1|nr:MULTISPECIES: MG2 domain-containing protein [Pontibacter]MBC5775843.1 hypothetical protein [Pontibacter sp. KCTC 32443]